MGRARFPYGHIDIMVTSDERSFIAEINLRGGIRGAKISSDEYGTKVENFHQSWLAEQLDR